ncbi:MAG: hypothetical protein IPJ82_02205 [Lewinellaceae bacterium]|nr:hypothetical protein [Lewinellaceae bacterium]
MKKLHFLIAALLFGSTFACEKKNNPGTYDNCCGTAPVADEVTLLTPADSNTTVGRIYLPNIFARIYPVALTWIIFSDIRQ